MRRGFTLIELIVVIAIIAILMSLVMAALTMIWDNIPTSETRNNILQVSAGLQKFKAKYGFYPPDAIKLYEDPTAYAADNSAIAKNTIQYLSAMWPRLDMSGNTLMKWGGPTVTLPAAGAMLEGDQCLVFFLAGPAGMNGFSTNPHNPTMVGGDRFKFLEFPEGRLQVVQPSPTRSSLFRSYVDGFGKMPLVYFSAGKFSGGYSAASTLGAFGVAPYKTSAGFLHPDSFQLISAGQDGQFGAGGLWTPPSVLAAGRDDMSNFHDKILGAP
jgi:prepilin-type N-terminal cleavage/methylation domain-containing protein